MHANRHETTKLGVGRSMALQMPGKVGDGLDGADGVKGLCVSVCLDVDGIGSLVTTVRYAASVGGEEARRGRL